MRWSRRCVTVEAWLVGLLLVVAQIWAGPARASDILVTNATELSSAITTASAGDRIVLQNNITLGTTLLPPVGSNITIDGNGKSIDAQGNNRIFFLNSTATIQNVTLMNGAAKGGDGGNATAGGGGGLGAGGAIFVNTGTATISNVTFSNNGATGGNGGTSGNTSGNAGGGGGGLGGAGGIGANGNGGGGGYSGGGGGGGGYIGGGCCGSFPGGNGGTGPGGNGGRGGDFNQNGAAGVNGGAGGNGSASFGGGGGGGGLGGGTGGSSDETSGFAGGAGGGGGGGGLVANSAGNGGNVAASGSNATAAGGGGGAGGFGFNASVVGGNGADFGGGGGGAGNGGNGGFGGGGGGAGSTGIGGVSAFGGGTGGSPSGNANPGTGVAGGFGGSGCTCTNSISGGGGAALGGAVFVRDGANLVIGDGTFGAGNTVTAGAGGGDAVGGFLGGQAGAAAGTSLFLMSVSGATSYTFNPTTSLTINGTIADDSAASLPGGTYQAGSAAGAGLAMSGAGTLFLNGANTFSGGTTINSGTVSVGADNNLGTGSVTMKNGSALTFTSSFSFTHALTIAGNATFNASSGVTADMTTAIANGASAGKLIKDNAGTVNLSAANTYSGGTAVNGGTLSLSGSGTLGAIAASTAVNTGGTLDLGATAQTQNGGVTLAGGTIQNGTLSSSATFDVQSGSASAALAGAGLLTKSTAGTATLSGTDTYTGATTVNSGTLSVSGSLTATSSVVVNSGGTLDVAGSITTPTVTVNSGGTLTGIGTVDPLAVTINSGATFTPGTAGTPGTSTAVVGDLTFQAGATYQLYLSPATSTFANVTGTATLGGATVAANFAAGSYVSKRYTILTTTGGVTGTFNPAITLVGPANLNPSLSYDASNAYLNIALNFVSPGGLNGNQQNVANAITGFFNATGNLPTVFSTLSANGLSQASGETATGSQQTTVQAMTQFTDLLTDQSLAGGAPDATSFAGGPSASALGYASTQRPSKATDAFARMPLNAPASFEQRWGTWLAGYGGTQTTNGSATAGSSTATGRIYGSAAGVDYRPSPDLLVGVALAGASTNFSVSGSGSGRSDMFQAGAFARKTFGATYVSGALAYGWQDITTDRTVTIAGLDQLRARFNANALSGRIETGYRIAASTAGVTPYAAAQFTSFWLPSYAESAVSGANTFALSYGAKTVTVPRSELGLRADTSFALPAAMLTLRGRVAWAHDYSTGHDAEATFQALPGASFIVNGAAPAPNAALASASAEFRWDRHWSATASFEGEFSSTTASYAGKGAVRYQW